MAYEPRFARAQRSRIHRVVADRVEEADALGLGRVVVTSDGQRAAIGRARRPGQRRQVLEEDVVEYCPNWPFHKELGVFFIPWKMTMFQSKAAFIE